MLSYALYVEDHFYPPWVALAPGGVPYDKKSAEKERKDMLTNKAVISVTVVEVYTAETPHGV